jgi:hypothetical protein
MVKQLCQPPWLPGPARPDSESDHDTNLLPALLSYPEPPRPKRPEASHYATPRLVVTLPRG